MSISIIVAAILGCFLIIVDVIVLTLWIRRRSLRTHELAESISGEIVTPVSHPRKPTVEGVPASQDLKSTTLHDAIESVDVFISYAEEDAAVAYEIALGLEEAGYITWCYELDNIPGVSYLLQTGQMIEKSRAFLVVISPNSLSSRQITQEVIRAHEANKPFFPVLRDITHAEFQSRQPEWREAIGAATSISITTEGAKGVNTRIVAGLKALGVHPVSNPDIARTQRIRKVLKAKQ